MKLSKEEFERYKSLHECVVEIASIQSNKVFVGGVEIEIVTTFTDSDGDKEYLLNMRNKMAKQLASMPRESPEKKALREDYKRVKADIAKKDDQLSSDTQANIQATRMGTLIKTPTYKGFRDGDMFICELECEVGDTVYWDGYWTCQEVARRRGEKGAAEVLIEVEDKMYLKIPSNALTCKRVGNDFFGLNGYVIAELIEPQQELVNGIYQVNEHPYARAKIHSVPTKLPTYRDTDVFHNCNGIKAGDVVTVPKIYPIRLDKTYTSDTNMVRFLNSMILTIEN